METAVEMLEAWCKTQPIKDMTIEIVRIDGRTPLLFIDIPGQSDDVVLLYGHYDKQPEFSGWDEDLDPWTPVIKDGKLYGRGGADAGTGYPACTLRCTRRGLRGKRQLRPALLH
jgi:acetylornithine deacetylase/succinyl-diaminopimelate desuccinylase-like protein